MTSAGSRTLSECAGTMQRDGEGGRSDEDAGWGDTCAPMDDSSRCMAKTTTIL